VYGYAYHRPKLDFVRAATLDDKRAGDTSFASLADFLESVPTSCPDDLFRRDVARATPPCAAPVRQLRFVTTSTEPRAIGRASLRDLRWDAQGAAYRFPVMRPMAQHALEMRKKSCPPAIPTSPPASLSREGAVCHRRAGPEER
jgi:hypothetical protein